MRDCLCAAKEMSQLSFWSITAMMSNIMGLSTREEHSAKCIIASNTSLTHATATGLLVQNGHDAEHRGPANIVDDKRGAVLLIHNDHDVEQLRPDDNRREHSAKRNVTRKTSIGSVPLPLSTTSAATRGAGGGPRRPPLPPLLPLPPPHGGGRGLVQHLLKRLLKRVQHLLLPLLLLLSFASCSSFLLSSRARRRRKERAASSTPSAAATASNGAATDGSPAALFARTASNSCGSGSFQDSRPRLPVATVFGSRKTTCDTSTTLRRVECSGNCSGDADLLVSPPRAHPPLPPPHGHQSRVPRGLPR